MRRIEHIRRRWTAPCTYKGRSSELINRNLVWPVLLLLRLSLRLLLLIEHDAGHLDLRSGSLSLLLLLLLVSLVVLRLLFRRHLLLLNVRSPEDLKLWMLILPNILRWGQGIAGPSTCCQA